jgi:hypothetical protein
MKVSFHDDPLWTFDKKLLQRPATRQFVEFPPAVAATVTIACNLGRGDIGGEAGVIRSADAMPEGSFGVATLDGFVPAHHPLRARRVPMSTPSMAMNRRSKVTLAGNRRDASAPEDQGRALSTGRCHGGTGKTDATMDALAHRGKPQTMPPLAGPFSVAHFVDSVLPLRYLYSCRRIRVLTNVTCARFFGCRLTIEPAFRVSV